MFSMRRLHLSVLLIAAILACDRQKPTPRAPLAESERRQFYHPLSGACWQEPDSWPQFAHDPLHTGRSDVDFETTDLELAWRFQPSKHAWAYESGFSVWSSPVAGTIAGRRLVIAGYQDSIVYAIDASTGEKAWEFRPGAPVFASPALAMVDGRPLVIVGCINRFVYGLDAVTGEKTWQYETVPWSFTLARSVMSSPTLIEDNGIPLVLIGVWNSDRSANSNIQSGECLAMQAADGRIRWRQRIGSVPVTSPAVATIAGARLVFVAGQHGLVQARRLQDGSLVWEATLNEETRSSPSLGLVADCPEVLLGSRLNCLFGLDARTGDRLWQASSGYWIDATPAWFHSSRIAESAATTTVVAGSYDRSVYAWLADTNQPSWKTTTGNYAFSSPAIATAVGRRVVFTLSWDQHLYMLDGSTGQVLWKAQSGPLLWSHAFMGDSLWASPAVTGAGGEALVLFPGLDGVLYGYRSRSPQKPVSSSGPG